MSRTIATGAGLHEHDGALPVAAGAPQGCSVEDGALVVRGDDTGARTTLVYADRRRIGVFDDWAALAAAVDGAGLLEVDPAGCQFLLAYGLVPPPHSPYRRVYALGIGDRLRVIPATGAAEFEVDFPYREGRSTGAERFDLARLRERLAAAVAAVVPAGEPALLMQSAGKDSTGLLLALAAAGRTRVRALTYDARFREREAGPAAALARRFGLEHRVVEADPVAELHALLGFLERAPSVCADVALIPYLRVLEAAAVSGGVVVDGLGNDIYMGYLQPRLERRLSRLSLPRRLAGLWGRFEPPATLGARAAYLWKSVQMFPAERCLAGSRPAPSTVLDLLPQRTPFETYFAELDRTHRGWSEIDFRACVRGRIYDGCGTMVKARLAAGHRGACAVFPYCDRELIDHCFHLPAASRYDARRGRNKLMLRRWIAAELGELPFVARKGSFRVDVQRFVETNHEQVGRELARAESLLPGLCRPAAWLLRRRASYVHAYELLTLLIVAGWLNRRPARALRALHATQDDLALELKTKRS